jgi:sugar/nucleoside kinase (ribokinase family)
MKDKVLILGGILVDHYMLVDQFPQRGQDVRILNSFYKVGGCAINVAKTLTNLGCDPYVVATVGGDQWGKMILHYLGRQRFHQNCIRIEQNKPSGYAVALVESSGERTFLTYKGCEDYFDAEMVGNDLLQEIGYVYLTGYYLLNPAYHRDMLRLLAQIRENGGKILFDPGPLVAEIAPDMLLSVIRLSSVVTPNETESEKIARKYQLAEEATGWSFAQGVDIVIEKAGGRGVRAWRRGESVTCPPYSVKSIDTTGAGDSFAGGFIYSLINGYPLDQAIRVASACGAITTTILGPHGEFTWEDVKQLMEK